MPYISLAEQGYKQPGDTIQDAARSLLANRASQQRTDQEAQAFPLEQQQRAAQAMESTKKAAVIDKSLALQQQAQDLANQGSQLNLAFQRETDPTKKQLLGQQVEQVKASIQNLAMQGQLLQAQAGETNARGGLYSAQANTARLGNASTTATRGALDPYGNSIVHTIRKDPVTGAVLQETDEPEKGRGIPRVAYKQVWDNNAGVMKRVPGIPEIGPDGTMTISFPDDEKETEQDKGPDSTLRGVVDKFFDSETGLRKKSWGGLGGEIQPSNAAERAQLNALLHNPAQLDAYALKLAPEKPAAAGPVAATTTPPAKPKAAAPALPSTPAVSDDEEASDEFNDLPQGSPEAKAAAKPVPLAGAKKQAGGGSTFKDLPIGAVFKQGGVSYKKTGDTTAVPAGS